MPSSHAATGAADASAPVSSAPVSSAPVSSAPRTSKAAPSTRATSGRTLRLAFPLALVVLAATTLSGCMVALPDPIAPERPGYPWTSTESQLWVIRTTHCGFCAPFPADGAHHLFVVHYDGSVIRIDYNVGENSTEADYGVRFTNATHQPYAGEVTKVWKGLYNAKPQYVTVERIQASQISNHDAKLILQVFQNAVQAAKPVGPPSFDCADCSGVTYNLFYPPQTLSATFGHPLPATGPWALLEQQMELLQQWLDHPPAEIHPIR